MLSTGTWVIAAALGAPLDRLDEGADMPANVNALGQPVACMRFMGGREFAGPAGTDAAPCGPAELERLVGRGTMALPCFSASGGPFVGRAGKILGAAPETPAERYALATLYCVLMSDYCLDALGATGPVVVEGSFTDNAHFAPLLAALRAGREVAVSDDASGTVCGAWMLRHWGRQPAANGRAAVPLALAGWPAYRARWRALLAAPA
ncbi:hypothetical protein ACFDR9_001460 [Janthinobacterium sp. CG_23.3]|uniref:hypothetical protein n=1 Tax=Janthinobacterium sp. CG_23.3 TaxID=3349634 RepID=UPI0038D37C92